MTLKIVQGVKKKKESVANLMVYRISIRLKRYYVPIVKCAFILMGIFYYGKSQILIFSL